MSNDGFRYRLLIKKNEKFKETFVGLMNDLGFKDSEVRSLFSISDEDRYYELKVKDICDYSGYYKNKNFEVDLFIGYKEIVMIIRTKKGKQIVDFLKNNSDWISEKEAEIARNKSSRKVDKLKKLIDKKIKK